MPTAKAPKTNKRKKAVADLNAEAAKEATPEKVAPVAKVAIVKVDPEVKHAIAILKLASLKTMPKTAPKKILDAIAMPTQEAIEALIEHAKPSRSTSRKALGRKKLLH